MKPAQPLNPLEFELADAAMTARAGRILAGLARPGDVLALWGDLGAGKTTLARGFISAVVPTEEAVPSPTFTLVQTYAADIGGSPVDIWHFDLYRLKSAEEAYEVGIEEAFAQGVSLIEWPERLGSLLPRHRLDVTLLPGVGAESRILSLAGPDTWMQRLGGFKSALSGE
jgi:tRNA threonylcarbamoyladenosine biosynthesis protein TsaE